MRILYKTLLLAIFLILGFLIVSTTAQSKQKSGLSLSEKVQNLMEMNNKNALLQFNGQNFREYVKNSPRNYSMIVMLTALRPFRECQICRHAHDEFQIVVQAYRFSPAYSNNVFFAMVDYDDGFDVFQLLNLNTAPVFLHFPPIGKHNTMDIQRVGFSAEAIGMFVAQLTDVQIRIFRPINYSGIVAVLTLAALAGGFLYMMRNDLDFLYNKSKWGAIAVSVCFTMISGHMWNHINDPPLVQKKGNGDVNYIHSGRRDQVVVETYIVLVLYTLIFSGILLLTDARSQTNPRKGRIMAVIGLALVVLFCSLLLSVFRSKIMEYPYHLLFR